MAITAARVDVLTTATLIATNSGSGDDQSTKSFLVLNATATANIFLGDSGVTTGTGLQWASTDGPLSIDLEPGESLYGRVASTLQTVHVLGGGR
jgi:hypothetical protein